MHLVGKSLCRAVKHFIVILCYKYTRRSTSHAYTQISPESVWIFILIKVHYHSRVVLVASCNHVCFYYQIQRFLRPERLSPDSFPKNVLFVLYMWISIVDAQLHRHRPGTSRKLTTPCAYDDAKTEFPRVRNFLILW